ncbi:helix-turn-helix transcriptional regulator [Serratia fonticola]
MSIMKVPAYLNRTNYGPIFIFFFSDSPTETGLNHLIKSNSKAFLYHSDNNNYDMGIYNTGSGDLDEKTQHSTIPVYDFINNTLILKRRYIDSKFIFLIENNNIESIRLLASLNIFYLLSKNEDVHFIHKAITNQVNIMSQKTSPKVIDKIPNGEINKTLSMREWFVLNSLARNLSPNAISKASGISIKTISAHKVNAMNKLRLTSPQLLKLLMQLAEVKSISTIMIKDSPK